MCFAASASALDPSRMISQYIRSAWGPEKGFVAGSVSAFAQTPDGYLWIGTDKGLVRFDGLNFHQFTQASPTSITIGAVQSLLADAKGNLWILLRSTQLLRYREGTFELNTGVAENGITAIGRGIGNKILLSSLAMGTFTYDGQQFESASSEPYMSPADAIAGTPDRRSTRLSWSAGLVPDRIADPHTAVVSIAATPDGKLWLGTRDRGLFYSSGGRAPRALSALADLGINCLLPLENGELWIGTARGVKRWNGAELTKSGVPSSLLNVPVLAMLHDLDSNMWVGTSRGLFRVNANGVSPLATSNRVTSDGVTALFEDREGNIWIGGPGGVERLRDSTFVTYAVPGRALQGVGPVYADPGNRIWFAPIEGGLGWLKGGVPEPIRTAGLGQDIVYSITGRGNDLWLGRQLGGLTHLRYEHGSFTSKTYTHVDGLAQNSVYAVYETRDGTVWAGTLSGGLSKLQNGHLTTYTTVSGVASDTVSSIAEDGDGTMWFGTPNGLTAMSNDGWRTYTARDGLSSPDVNCLWRDSQGVLWIGTAAGLAWLAGDHIQVLRESPDSLHEPIFGIAEDRNGWLWIATAGHVLQVNRNSLVRNSLNQTDIREYGIEDGLQGTEGVKRFQSVVTDSQGQVWISTNRGLSVVNPARASVNAVPALVHLEGVFADGMPLDLESARIPPGKQRITFRYVGLSLSNSERVRYRYKLDGFDHGWSEPVTNLEATYGNLSAGSYRFRVMASNGDGLWNGSDAAVGFEVEPAVWETWWFRLACALGAGLATLIVYRLRMLRVADLLNVRFEERLAERTRIAQELHDTLLQGLLSMSMHLHVAIDQLPDDSPARTTINRVMQLMKPVIEEGRNTIRGLQSSIENPHDLTKSFSQIPDELGQHGADFRVVVEGAPLPLRPAVRDQVYRIGREALVNAFRHSGAGKINLHLEYGSKQLRILIQDDGRGINSLVSISSREGHSGLSGMREQAQNIGGKLRVMSRSGGGTEIELRVPSHIAFEAAPLRHGFKLLSFH